jgi:hypothetical protein
MARSLLDITMAGVTDDDREADLKRLEAEIELMERVGNVTLIAPDHVESHERQTQRELVRGGSRRIQVVLFELDKARHFHGLNRTPVTSTGEFYWVCPTHMSTYDPGLPAIRR